MKVWADILSRSGSSIFITLGLVYTYVDQVKKSNQSIQLLREQNARLKQQQQLDQHSLRELTSKLEVCAGSSTCIQHLVKQVLDYHKKP